MTEKTMLAIKIDAANGAAKLCKGSECIAAFQCGKEKPQAKFAMPLIGAGTVCPLAKYKVPDRSDPRPGYEIPSSELEVTQNELFALCACCEHAILAEAENGQLVVNRLEFKSYCLDCPVKIVEDSIHECAAEARAECS